MAEKIFQKCPRMNPGTSLAHLLPTTLPDHHYGAFLEFLKYVEHVSIRDVLTCLGRYRHRRLGAWGMLVLGPQSSP